MSKWLNKDKFKAFVNKRQEDQSSEDVDGYAKKWKNPTMGTVEKAKEYTIRLLPDKQSQFYLRYFYHYFVSDLYSRITSLSQRSFPQRRCKLIQ